MAGWMPHERETQMVCNLHSQWGRLPNNYINSIVTCNIIMLVFSTSEVLQYMSTLPSTRLDVLPVQLRSDFDEVTDEKAHTLHDTLEAVDRYV